MSHTSRQSLSIVVLISGNGSNLQAMIDAKAAGLPIDICAVISNKSDAYGLERARDAHIPTQVVSHQDYASRLDFDAALQNAIEQYHPQLVVLAGFMRRLESPIVSHFLGRMINIHPSLLPKYPGLHTYKKVLRSGDSQHGSSIHFVTDDVDGGPLICQAALDIRPKDTPDSLKSRVQKLEHILYPKALGWFAAERVQLEDQRVLLDNQVLPPNGKQLNLEQEIL